MTKKVTPLPLKLKRPDGYVPQLPQNYKPPKSSSKSKEPKQPKQPKQVPLRKEKVIRQIKQKPLTMNEKKKNFLPGQKHQTPDQDDGARICKRLTNEKIYFFIKSVSD